MKKLFDKLKNYPSKKLIITVSAIALSVILAVSGILIYHFTKPCKHLLDGGTVLKEPLCNEVGSKIYTCQYCGYTEYTEIPVREHDFEEIIITDATCKDEGKKMLTCKLCSLEKEEVIGITEDHTFEFKIKTDSTCTEKGLQEEVCTLCGTIGKSEDIELKEHTYTEAITKPATCISEGEKDFTCSVCGDSYTESVPKGDHNWSAANCTSASVCFVCNTTNGSALGHTTENGKCGRCSLYIGTAKMSLCQAFPKTVVLPKATTIINEPVFSYEKISDDLINTTMSFDTVLSDHADGENMFVYRLWLYYKIYDSTNTCIREGHIIDYFSTKRTFTCETTFILSPGEYRIEFYKFEDHYRDSCEY